jgi:hypothetical protein
MPLTSGPRVSNSSATSEEISCQRHWWILAFQRRTFFRAIPFLVRKHSRETDQAAALRTLNRRRQRPRAANLHQEIHLFAIRKSVDFLVPLIVSAVVDGLEGLRGRDQVCEVFLDDFELCVQG